MPDSLERIYRAVPPVQRKGLCTQSCGPIGMSVEERRRIEQRGVNIPTPDEAVAALTAGNRSTAEPSWRAAAASTATDR